MTRRVLISGSVAYDNIMVFEGHFKDHILADRVHMLNVSFLTPRMTREFGGCAANIAFNLRALGGEPVILATVGRDGDDYLSRLAAMGIDVSQMLRLDDTYTPQCFITTDLSDNQITAFHPGAMSFAHQVDARRALPAAWGIVGPNGKDAMIEHARGLRDSKVPFVFDPGQGLPMFDGGELRGLLEGASALTVNDYESKMLADRTGLTETQLAALVDVMIVTCGAEGSQLHRGGVVTHVAAAPIGKAVDPTGCGDAYRGGLLYGLSHGWDWLKSARLGSVLGAMKIEHSGPQNHGPTRDKVAQRYEATWNEPLFDRAV